MTNFMNGISSILGAFSTDKTTTTTETRKAKKLTEAYQAEAENITDQFGTGRTLSQKALEESSLLTDLNRSKRVKVAKLLGSMSTAEIARLLRAADDGDGDVTPEERLKLMNGLVLQLENGASPERIQAGLNAKFLKKGGEVSDSTKKEWIAQFKELGIPKEKYTPDATLADSTDTEEGATGFEKYAPLIKAGLPLLQGLMGKTATTTADTTRDQAKALELRQEIARLQASQALPSSLGSLPPLSFASQLPPPLSSPLGSLPPLPSSQMSLLGLDPLANNPLLPAAGNNISLTLMPAQATFAQPVAQQQPFTFAQPAPTVATAPASTAWTAPAPVAPNLVAQAPPFNGGW
jgi:hypothetical protein